MNYQSFFLANNRADPVLYESLHAQNVLLRRKNAVQKCAEDTPEHAEKHCQQAGRRRSLQRRQLKAGAGFDRQVGGVLYGINMDRYTFFQSLQLV